MSKYKDRKSAHAAFEQRNGLTSQSPLIKLEDNELRALRSALAHGDITGSDVKEAKLSVRQIGWIAATGRAREDQLTIVRSLLKNIAPEGPAVGAPA